MSTPTRVFEVVSADFFEHAGRTYFVDADRLSGWPSVCHMSRSNQPPTGVPSLLVSDGGPQFAAKKTRDLLT